MQATFPWFYFFQGLAIGITIGFLMAWLRDISLFHK